MNPTDTNYQGILAIGDPHLESRIPGFRKDDYPRIALNKIAWCMSYAQTNQLLPIFLGDIFHLPRDNANWLLGELLVLFNQGVIGIYGNHDVHQNELTEDDSIDILIKAGKYQLLNEKNIWQGRMNGRAVVIGGTSWGKFLPTRFDFVGEDTSPLVLWVTHHDVKIPGYEEQGRFNPREIPGIQVIINGHIHRRLENVKTGSTVWITPGNIVRRQRNDATREHIPSALHIAITSSGWSTQHIKIPHKPFEEVFHEAVLPDSELVDRDVVSDSAFVAGLAEMLARKTDTASGLMEFLAMNLDQFEEDVAKEISKLAQEVTNHVN